MHPEKISSATVQISWVVAFLSGAGILFAEANDWSQGPFHVSQLASVSLCFLSSILLLIIKRARFSQILRAPRNDAFAWLSVFLSGSYLALFALFLYTFDMSGLD